MPTYDYKCPRCPWGGELMFVGFDSRKEQQCPECKAPLGEPIPSSKIATKTVYGGMKAVVTDRNENVVGHVLGHFGKTAKRRK